MDKKRFSVQKLVIMAFMVALSIVLGRLFKLDIGTSYRLSLENLPILLSGVVLGPVQGALVGATSDLLGGFLIGKQINPFITLGACSVGLISGLIYRIPALKGKPKWRCMASSYGGHIVGSMTIKTAALYLYFPDPTMPFIRVGIYVLIAAVEGTILYGMLKTDIVKKFMERT